MDVMIVRSSFKSYSDGYNKKNFKKKKFKLMGLMIKKFYKNLN